MSCLGYSLTPGLFQNLVQSSCFSSSHALQLVWCTLSLLAEPTLARCCSQAAGRRAGQCQGIAAVRGWPVWPWPAGWGCPCPPVQGSGGSVGCRGNVELSWWRELVPSFVQATLQIESSGLSAAEESRSETAPTRPLSMPSLHLQMMARKLREKTLLFVHFWVLHIWFDITHIEVTSCALLVRK